ncbi:MAG TPA: porin [Chryseosolibacter sp.]
MRKNLMGACLILLSFSPMKAQQIEWTKPDSLFKYVQPFASVQLWAVYTMNEKLQMEDNGPLEDIEDRLNFLTRRARIGFKGKPYRGLSYFLNVQYDNLGKDRFGAIRGGVNTGQLGILDAYVSYKLSRNSDAFHITAGYFHPQFSRESITGDMNVNSFDKPPLQGYVRDHITGKSYGRTTGVNLGGNLGAGAITIGYNVSVCNNNTTGTDATETSGRFWSPLIVDRVTFSVGDPDKKSYSLMYESNNYFNERKGITVGINSSRQGKTDKFDANQFAGVDVMLNYNGLNLDAEGARLMRRIEGVTYQMTTWQIRGGFNIIVAQKSIVEPMMMYMKFQGDPGATSEGLEEMYDMGVNWYLNKKNLKLTLHYIKQSGFGDNGYTDDETFRKGDFVGLGFVSMF